jgi:O-antigen biosynthesis protein
MDLGEAMNKFSAVLMDPGPSASEAKRGKARLEDMEFLYRVFLGRERELSGKQDERVGACLDDVTRGFIESAEFTSVVHDSMMAGRPVPAPVFYTPPSVELRNWVVTRLALSSEGRSRAARARSWYELHSTIFADPLFRRDVIGADSPAAQLAAAPMVQAQFARFEDIEFLYRAFLGRERELSRKQDEKVGACLDDVTRGFIESAEFTSVVHDSMMAGRPVLAPGFYTPPTMELRNWVATRLTLSPEGRSRVAGAHSWYELHSTIFADPLFRSDVIGADSPAAQLAAAPMTLDVQAALIEASLLFDRDWYLETYRDVAASGGDPLQHYLAHGVAESRNPNRLFDTQWYLSAYPHVKSERINPLAHYILKGARLGYDPHPFFSTKDFLRDHPTAAESEFTPLGEFIRRMMLAAPASFPKFGPYEVYKATQDNYRRLELPELLRHIETMTITPTFIVLIDGHDDGAISATRESLSRQTYRHFRAVSSVKEVGKVAETDKPGSTHFLWLDAGDEVGPDALYELAAALNADPSLELIYFDHEVALDQGLAEPYHKPDWSPDYFESFNYIGSAACFELSKAVQSLLGADGRYDFILRFTDAPANIAHLGRVLLRRHPADPARLSPEQEASDIRAIRGRLARTGRTGTVKENIPGAGSYDVRIALRAAPLVSVLIPTAGRIITYEGKRIDLIVECLESVLKKSSYRNIEFIIVDNGDFDRDRLKHIETGHIKFITYSSPDVNIAKKINLGASIASGQIFLILNDDIEPLTSDWIERMLAHLEKSHVGVVGAKLLYPKGTIQHAGIVACDGDPEHVRRGKPRDDIGFAFSTCGVRNYLAVTGAVSMVRAKHFWLVGGYSEEFPIDYNDVDFCYKLVEAGYYVVYEPKAELIHYESVSIVKPPRPWDAQHFGKKWASIANDPFYNEYCFSKHPPMFEPVYTQRRH